MKPLRRLLDKIEACGEEGEDEPTSWEPVDPSTVPQPDPISQQDFEDAMRSTRSTSSQHLIHYDSWFKSLGSV